MSGANSADDSDSLIDSIETDAIWKGSREYSGGPDDNARRGEIKEWIRSHPDEVDSFLKTVTRGAKLYTLRGLDAKSEEIEEVTGGDASVIADALNLTQVYYYKSYFGYTDHTTWVYKLLPVGGVLEEIGEEADTAQEAQEMFRSFCRSNGFEDYYRAAGESPAPLIGNLGDKAKPRLIHFEDSDHLYVQYWSTGTMQSGFDVESGEYESINTIEQPYLRIHLESGLVEVAGDDSQAKSRYRKRLNEFIDRFGNGVISPVSIGQSAIESVKQNVALQVSLDEFEGDDAKIQFSRGRSRGNVEADEIHETAEEERDRLRSNFQLILGKRMAEWGLIHRDQLDDRFENKDSVTVAEALSEFKEDQSYDEVVDLTLSLNRDKETFRVQKKRLSPTIRRSVFHLLAEELDW